VVGPLAWASGGRVGPSGAGLGARGGRAPPGGGPTTVSFRQVDPQVMGEPPVTPSTSAVM